eukprot:gb/GEZN01014791.1/.p2 GENE.gb/GEZN01014791.1/~~gb/GEZN01014791.1/.p2  ORF type:complete len:156 (+),score=8.26 gb/GEZN01014791.1/:24-470(+)
MWRKAPISMLIFVSLLGHIFDLLPLVSAQRDGAEDDENAVVFVPEYNEVDCAALTTKRSSPNHVIKTKLRYAYCSFRKASESYVVPKPAHWLPCFVVLFLAVIESACRKERSQCVWQRSEATCVKKGHAEVEGRQGMESGDDIAHEEL